MVRAGLIDSNHHKNGVFQQKHQLESIDENYTVYQTTPRLILHGIAKIPAFMHSENLDVTSNQSLHCLKIQITGHNKDHSWVTPAAYI